MCIRDRWWEESGNPPRTGYNHCSLICKHLFGCMCLCVFVSIIYVFPDGVVLFMCFLMVLLVLYATCLLYTSSIEVSGIRIFIHIKYAENPSQQKWSYIIHPTTQLNTNMQLSTTCSIGSLQYPKTHMTTKKNSTQSNI